MSGKKLQFNARELIMGSPAYRMASVSPDPGGNRAQRRAWAKLTKHSKPAATPSTPEGTPA